MSRLKIQIEIETEINSNETEFAKRYTHAKAMRINT